MSAIALFFVLIGVSTVSAAFVEVLDWLDGPRAPAQGEEAPALQERAA